MRKIIKLMRLTKSAGNDRITMLLIKWSLCVLAKPLLNIVNTSITTNNFPHNTQISENNPNIKA